MTATGDVAKAFLDALPSLDFNKLVAEARKSGTIVLAGDKSAVAMLHRQLLGESALPDDTKFSLTCFDPENASGKSADLVIVVNASDEEQRKVREAFPNAPIQLAHIGDGRSDDNTAASLQLSWEPGPIRRVLVPAIVDRLWDKRLALGRGVPATRDEITKRQSRNSARDVRVILGSVAGAGGGRSGAPTPATAQLLMHQAVLIVSIAAVYGAPLEDKRAIFSRVAPSLAPTLLLDGAEAGISKLAASAGKGNKYEKLYGPVAAYVARPALSASSTLIAGATARRVFRGDATAPSVLGRTRRAGGRLLKRARHGAGNAAATVADRVRTYRGPGAHEDSRVLPAAADEDVLPPATPSQD